MDIVTQLNAKQVYIYAMGMEPWLTFLTSIQYTEQSRPIVESDKVVAECKSRGIISERLFGQKEIILQSVPTSVGGTSFPGLTQLAEAASV